MAQQSIFGRMQQLVKANVNSLLDAAEDPEKMLDQMIRDYTANIQEAEEAAAQTIGSLRLLEADVAEDRETAAEWGSKAAAAAQRAQQLQAQGNAAEADKFTNLAKIALKKQIDAENEVKELEPGIAAQNEVVNKLKNGLELMRHKREELVSKRDELVARAKMAQAQTQVTDALKSVNVMDPTSELGRFEEKIRREEAKVVGAQELAASSLDAQFESLDDVSEDLEVEARLAALTGGSAGAIPATAGAGASSGETG
jgi:phage shock protein A